MTVALAMQQLMAAVQPHVEEEEEVTLPTGARKRARNGHFVASDGPIDLDAPKLPYAIRQVPWHLLSPFDAWEKAWRQDASLLGHFFEFCVEAMSTATLVQAEDGSAIPPNVLTLLTPQQQYDLLICRTQAVSFLTKGFQFLYDECSSTESPALQGISKDLAIGAVPELIVYSLPSIHSVFVDTTTVLMRPDACLDDNQLDTLAFARPVFLNAFNIFVRLLRPLPDVLLYLQRLAPNATDIYVQQTASQKGEEKRDAPQSELAQLHAMMAQICTSALQAVVATEALRKPRIKASHTQEQHDLLRGHVSTILEQYTALMGQQCTTDSQATASHVAHWLSIVLSLFEMDAPFFYARLKLCHQLVHLVECCPANVRQRLVPEMDKLVECVTGFLLFHLPKKEAVLSSKEKKVITYLFTQWATLLKARRTLPARLHTPLLRVLMEEIKRRLLLVGSLHDFLTVMDQTLRLLYVGDGPCVEVASSFLQSFKQAPSGLHAAVKLSLYSVFLAHASDSGLLADKMLWEALLQQWRRALNTTELVPAFLKEEAISSLILFCLTASSTVPAQTLLLQTYMTTPYPLALDVTFSILDYLVRHDEAFSRQLTALHCSPLPGQHNVTLVRLRRLQPSTVPVFSEEDAQVALTTMALSLDLGGLAIPEMEDTLAALWQKESSDKVRCLLVTMTLRVFGQVDLTRPITIARVEHVVETLTLRLSALTETPPEACPNGLSFEAAQYMPCLVRLLRLITPSASLLTRANACMKQLGRFAFSTSLGNGALLHASLCALTALKIMPPSLKGVLTDVLSPSTKEVIGLLVNGQVPPFMTQSQEHGRKEHTLARLEEVACADLERYIKDTFPPVVAKPKKTEQKEMSKRREKEKMLEREEEEAERTRSWKGLSHDMRDLLLAHQHRLSIEQKDKVREQLLTLLSIVDQ